MVREFEGSGYWALILGGSSGLGYASALKLARHGMHICIVHQNSRSEMPEIDSLFQALEKTGVRLMTCNIDACRDDSLGIVLDRLAALLDPGARIRCLLHSISKGNLKPLLDDAGGGDAGLLSGSDFLFTQNTMAISLYTWAQAVRARGLFAADGRILAFTSEGSHRAWKSYAAVSAAKASLEAISRAMALEFAPAGIRSNCIQAGITDTRSLRMIPGSEALIERAIERNPFGRLTLPEDVANLVYLLCKDEAAWINGAVIPVDGGEQIS